MLNDIQKIGKKVNFTSAIVPKKLKTNKYGKQKKMEMVARTPSSDSHSSYDLLKSRLHLANVRS